MSTVQMSYAHILKTNRNAAIVHIVTACIVIYLYNHWPATQTRSTFEVFRSQIAGPDTITECSTSTIGPPTQCNSELAFQKPANVTSVNLIYGTIAFFLITAAAHIFYATDGFGSRAYTSNLAQGWNPFRWFEYAVSASIMSVLIGLADGVRDSSTLILLAGVTAAMQFNGFTVESLLRGKQKLSANAVTGIQGSTVSGWILFVILWSVLIYSFLTLKHDVDTLYSGETGPDNKPIQVPSWIIFVVLFQLVYYASFGIVQFKHIQKRLKGPYDYLSTESSYIWLSYFAKLSLGAGLSYGLLFRFKDC